MPPKLVGLGRGGFLSLLLLFVLSCAPKTTPALWQPEPIAPGASPKNIVLMIGDGMALAQISASYYWERKQSVFRFFPYVGFHKSHSCDDLVTDSAAGGTALACGAKTTNSAIGVIPPDNKPCLTILEELSQRGYATGMVTTCSATHATPATFIAHRDLRAFTEEIAEDYLNTAFDCFIGGGSHYFGKRSDGRNLIEILRQRGYVVRNGTSFNRLPLDGSAPFALFTAEREPPTPANGRHFLPQAAAVACEYLSKRSDKGFFLMVEGSQIDWAGHANDAAWLRDEMRDFERTIQRVLQFASQNGETLVLVTGDHECGGLALHASSRNMPELVFSQKLHTAALVPILAYGPGAEHFAGLYDNSEVYWKMRRAILKTDVFRQDK